MQPFPTDVAILCGGLGTRLRSVLPDTPKVLAAFEGRPFLALLLDHLAGAGFRRFVLCTGYRAEAVAAFFAAGKFPHPIEFSAEDRPLGTAGALAHARPLLRSDAVVVLNGDSFCAVDYAAMLRAHAARQAAATVAIAPARPAEAADGRDYGRVILDASDRITAFAEKSADPAGGVNAGVYVFDRRTLDALPPRRPLSLEREVFPGLAGRGLFGFRVPGPLLDIGTPERYKRAHVELLDLMGR